MSRLPKVDKKPKNNKSTKFRWVDMQWEKFMNRHDENMKIIDQLQEDLVTCNKFFQERREQILKLEMQNAEMIDRLKDTGDEAWLKSEGILTPTNFSQMELDFEVTKNTENDDFEVKKPMIHESPDGGKTIYSRELGDYGSD